MSHPNNGPQYRAWSGDDSETQMFDGGDYQGSGYPDAGHTQAYPANGPSGASGPSGPSYRDSPSYQDAPRYQEAPRFQDSTGPEPREQRRPKKQRRTATLPEMFRLAPMWIEMVIIAIVGGVLYGMICWVADLLLVRLSDAVGGGYYGMDGTFEYTMRGIAFGFFVLVAALILMALAAAVNNPAQIFGWLFIAVLLWAVIVLLTTPMWRGIPEVLLLLVGAGIIWSVMPMRVQSYRTTVPRFY